jgi:hypothetical protein
VHNPLPSCSPRRYHRTPALSHYRLTDMLDPSPSSTPIRATTKWSSGWPIPPISTTRPPSPLFLALGLTSDRGTSHTFSENRQWITMLVTPKSMREIDINMKHASVKSLNSIRGQEEVKEGLAFAYGSVETENQTGRFWQGIYRR